MGHLCGCSRSHIVAMSRRWYRTAPTDVSAGTRRAATLVARREADCLRQHADGQAMEDLAHPCERRNRSRNSGRNSQPDRCQLVVRRLANHVRLPMERRGKHPDRRLEDTYRYAIPGSDNLFSPRWSPDGRYVAALSPDFTRVMLFDFKTRKWSTWFSESAGAVSYPVWSADSKYLYFDDLVTDQESIRRVKVGESQPERVFVLEGIERYPGQFGLWTSPRCRRLVHVRARPKHARGLSAQCGAAVTAVKRR